MTLWSSAKVGLSRLWKILAMSLRYSLAKATGEHRNWKIEAYLLHPRCCRTENYFEENI